MKIINLTKANKEISKAFKTDEMAKLLDRIRAGFDHGYEREPTHKDLLSIRETQGIVSEGELLRHQLNGDTTTGAFNRLEKVRIPETDAKAIRDLVIPSFPEFNRITGHFVYPPGGFMSWHTNSNSPGLRAYLNYVTEGGRGGFYYWRNNKINFSPDSEGWTLRVFRAVAAEPFFWHAVHTEVRRFSLGLKLDSR